MERDNKVIPYRTSTGIEIGSMYERKQSFEMSYDMELLQACLLDDYAFIRKERVKNFLMVVGAIAFVLFLIAITK